MKNLRHFLFGIGLAMVIGGFSYIQYLTWVVHFDDVLTTHEKIQVYSISWTLMIIGGVIAKLTKIIK